MKKYFSDLFLVQEIDIMVKNVVKFFTFDRIMSTSNNNFLKLVFGKLFYSIIHLRNEVNLSITYFFEETCRDSYFC